MALMAICALACARSTSSNPTPPERLVRSFLQAQQAVMQANAGEAEVQHLLTFLTDSFVYEHPRAGARIAGRAPFGDGIRSFLHSTRQAQIMVTSTLVQGGLVVVDQRVTFEVQREGQWRPDGRTQVTVFDVEGDHISRIVDFWQPPQP
jgi:hypothetical protein